MGRGIRTGPDRRADQLVQGVVPTDIFPNQANRAAPIAQRGGVHGAGAMTEFLMPRQLLHRSEYRLRIHLDGFADRGQGAHRGLQTGQAAEPAGAFRDARPGPFGDAVRAVGPQPEANHVSRLYLVYVHRLGIGDPVEEALGPCEPDREVLKIAGSGHHHGQPDSVHLDGDGRLDGDFALDAFVPASVASDPAEPRRPDATRGKGVFGWTRDRLKTHEGEVTSF